MNLPVSLKTIANVLGIVLLIALVAPFAVYAVPGLVGAEYSFVVLTASMTPAIAPGDVVIVDERDPAAIAEGDVITFVRSGNEVPVTHRVIDVVDGPAGVAFETQGDANGGPDASLVPGENVLGVVAITIPYIGYVVQFTDSPLGFAALVVVPFGLLVLSELWTLFRARDGNATDGSAAPDGDEESAAAGAGTGAGAAGAGAGAAGAGVATATDPDAASGGVSVDSVVGAGLVLAAFAPYSVYVAVQLRTALAITVAIATTVLLLAALAMWAAASGVFDRSRSSGTGTATETGTVADTGAATDSPAVTAPDEPPMATDGAGEVD
ncbi:peptidase S26B, signal peptidase [Halorubrum aidingense JCM 13560]|uniref:Peptidase S26B, signal peptidase n=1 Tax=Halorubrum aidingense JCM 13560 TaxID=1230454 RepID=M0P6I1_9EURY|nr:signal peptidase I [Halorubrum aidingense]EMA65762.1 peptidase S26B, signal peptidase [Halorubrum aidingense JCM 13560]